MIPLFPRRPTQKQIVARTRSWRIFQLRGMYKQMEAIKNPKRREIMRALIDDELTSLNAQTETDRESQLLQRLDQTIPF